MCMLVAMLRGDVLCSKTAVARCLIVAMKICEKLPLNSPLSLGDAIGTGRVFTWKIFDNGKYYGLNK